MLMSTSMAPAMVRELCLAVKGRDILHIHMPDPMAALALWAVRPESRLVVHWHSDVIRQRHAMKLYAPLQRWLLRRADAIVTTSQSYADSSETLQHWRNKVSVIPIGISDKSGHADEAKVAAIRHRFGGRRIVFSLGRMTYYKGFEVLIRAAAGLPDDCMVLIGGDGDLLPHYRAMVSGLGLRHKVRLLGHVEDGDLPSYFEACDVFCMTSTVRAEAYGVTLVEAMAMGKPIVATDIVGSGVPWVNRHGVTGFNMPVGQPGPLAEALRALLDDPILRRSLGRAGRQRYLQEFNADSMTRKTLDLYSRLQSAAA
jgi:rhamnosyl/mannosyltransferase